MSNEMLNVRKVTWEIRDKNGQLKSFEVQRPNSYTQHFVNFIYCAFNGTSMVSLTDTGGNPNTMSMGSASNSTLSAGAGVDAYGLVVGTSSQVVAIDNSKLIEKIAQATLAHSATTFTTPTTVVPTRSFTIQRTYTNNSGGDVTVHEIGLYGLFFNTKYFMIERALSTKTIANGTTGTLTYTIGTTV